MKLRDFGIAASLLWLALSGCGGSASKPSSSSTVTGVNAPTQAGRVPQFKHVALLVLENQKEDQILGNPFMPYMSSLAKQNAYASEYYANVHPSLGNYFFLTAGQVISNDLSFAGDVTADNIFREITVSKKTWKAYLESLPVAGYVDDNAVPYVKTHNPAAYFSDIRNDPVQAANMVPFTQLASDIASNNLPDFIYIAPNQNNNMHDCSDTDEGPNSNCSNDDKLAVGDAWVQRNIAPLLSSAAFKSSGLLIVTWDESWGTDSAHGGGHVLTILTGKGVKQGFVSTTLYAHESTLRTICDALQVPCMAAATSAPSMSEFFVGN